MIYFSLHRRNLLQKITFLCFILLICYSFLVTTFSIMLNIDIIICNLVNSFVSLTSYVINLIIDLWKSRVLVTIQEIQPSECRIYALHNTSRHKTIKNGMSIGHGFEGKWVGWMKKQKLLTTMHFIKKWIETGLRYN